MMPFSQDSVRAVANPYLIQPATIVEKIREAEDIDTYRLRFVDEQVRRSYRFAAGQFNMVYLFGVGEAVEILDKHRLRPMLCWLRSAGSLARSHKML